MRVALYSLVVISVANLGLQVHLHRRLAARLPGLRAPATQAAPAVLPGEPPSKGIDPALLKKLLGDWPRDPDGTMPPR